MSQIWCETDSNTWFGFNRKSIVKKSMKNLKNIREVRLCQDNFHLLQSDIIVLCNNFISYLSSNFEMHPHLSQMLT